MNKKRSLLRDLEAIAAIQPSAEATRQAIERARAAVLAQESKSATNNFPLTRRRIMSLRNVAAVAAALGVIFVLTHWLAPHGSPGGLVLGDVQAQVAKTKTLQYVETRRDLSKQGQVEEEMIRRVKILGSHCKRDEVETIFPRDPAALKRRGTPSEPYVMIDNVQTGKSISLWPQQNGYIIPQGTFGITSDGEVKQEKIEPRPEVDFYKRFAQISIETAKRLADKTIDGRPAAGFQVIETAEAFGGTTTWTRNYWIDPKTKLPVRIETTIRSTSPTFGDTDFVQTNFIFDQPLDEALFSTDPPEGYKDLAAEAEVK